MTQLIASNQLTLTNVNDGQPIKDNLFSASNFALTKYVHPSQPTILVSWKYNGKPNTKYTLSTDVPKNVQGTYDLFFGIYPSTPSSASNGVAINEPRTITTDATGIIEITARIGTTAGSIIAKTNRVKLEENDRMTAFIFHPDDQIGDKGADGLAGKDGKGITNTVITYGISANETTQPTNWTASVPTLVKGQYLWTKTVWTYTDNTNETGYTKTYIAKDGNNGTNGIAGKDGVGITSTSITYARSTSGTSAPSSGWTSAVPSVPAGEFFWTKTIWNYSDSTSETGYSVAKMGEAGPKGEDGQGSRNYAEDYRFERGLWEYHQGDSSTRNYKVENGVYQVTGSTLTWRQYQIFSKTGSRANNNNSSTALAELEAGKKITVSFRARCVSGNPNIFVALRENRKVTAGGNPDRIRKEITLTNEWATYTATTDSLVISPEFDYWRIILGYTQIGTVEFEKVELVVGGERYNIGPAVEDLRAKIDAKPATNEVVLKTDVSVTNEGIIHSASKTVNGQTIASMIAQRAEWVEIIAQLLKVKGDMIVDGEITGDKLDVSDLSAISADLGSVNAGKMLLQRSFSSGRSNVPAYNFPAFKTGLFVDDYGLIVNGSPVQKFTTEATASDMPVVAVTSGEIRFLRANLTDNIEEVLHTGLADPDFGYIQFGRDLDGRNALIIEANGQVYLKGQNYTDWAFSTIDNRVRWKVQGNLVIVDYDVTFSSSGTQAIVFVPTTYVPKALMLMVKAWRLDNDKDRNAQLNADGGLHILGAEANQRYCGQILWSY